SRTQLLSRRPSGQLRSDFVPALSPFTRARKRAATGRGEKRVLERRCQVPRAKVESACYTAESINGTTRLSGAHERDKCGLTSRQARLNSVTWNTPVRSQATR